MNGSIQFAPLVVTHAVTGAMDFVAANDPNLAGDNLTINADIGLRWSWASTWERRLEALARWPHALVGPRTLGQRHTAGGVFLAAGVALLALGSMGARGLLYQWGVLGVLVAAWLLLGRFEGEAGERWVRLTYKASVVLGFILVSSLVGEMLWWLILQPWNPLTWRLYSLWAILQILIATLGVAVIALGVACEASMPTETQVMSIL